LNIGLVAERFASESGVGPERYSYELLESLYRLGVKVRPISSNPRRRRLALAINAFTLLPLKQISAITNVDLFHATDPSSAIALPFLSKPSVVTFHDTMAFRYRGGQFGVMDRMFSLLTFLLTTKCSIIIAVSTQTKRELIRFFRLPEEKVRVINPGISEHFKVLMREKSEPPLFGFVGNLTKRKGVDFLLAAFRLLVKKYIPDAKLAVVGQGSDADKLVAMARNIGIQNNVFFLNAISNRELAVLYNRMHVLFFPSEYEGFGLPILEAQKCGTPVIIRRGAAISPEVAKACIKVSTPDEMAREAYNLTVDRKRYDDLVEQGLRHAKNFRWEVSAQKTLAIYEELLQRKGKE